MVSKFCLGQYILRYWTGWWSPTHFAPNAGLSFVRLQVGELFTNHQSGMAFLWYNQFVFVSFFALGFSSQTAHFLGSTHSHVCVSHNHSEVRMRGCEWKLHKHASTTCICFSAVRWAVGVVFSRERKTHLTHHGGWADNDWNFFFFHFWVWAMWCCIQMLVCVLFYLKNRVSLSKNIDTKEFAEFSVLLLAVL